VGSDVVALIKTITTLFLKEVEIITEAFLSTDFLERLTLLFFERHSNNHIHNAYKDALVSVLKRLNSDIFQHVVFQLNSDFQIEVDLLVY